MSKGCNAFGYGNIVKNASKLVRIVIGFKYVFQCQESLTTHVVLQVATAEIQPVGLTLDSSREARNHTMK
jgi:GTP cyclohydrolase I